MRRCCRRRGDDIVVTTDAIVEGVHFLSDDPPDTIARKALRVNLSDLAAKGAIPAGFVLTLALRSADDAWLTAFARGLGEDAKPLRLPAARRRYRFHAGSADDLDHRLRTAAPRQNGPSQRRQARRPCRGDGDDRRRRAWSRYPARWRSCRCGLPKTPRQERCWSVATACRSRAMRWRKRFAIMRSAAMDVSDGLAGDLAKLCAASGVSAVIDAPSIPLSAPVAITARARHRRHRDNRLRRRRLRDSCAPIPEDRFEAFAHAAAIAGVAVTSIGTVIAGDVSPAVSGRARAGRSPLPRLSYSHF